MPSPKVETYDLQPEMNAPEVAEKLVKAIHSNQYDVIICNFANADMVGHTGNFDATVKAIETLDNCLGKIWSALKESGGEMLVTADHGNAEKMVRRFTKKVKNDGIIEEFRDRIRFRKPSDIRRQKKAATRKKIEKANRERETLLNPRERSRFSGRRK